ncbi:hypothetical protein EI94DRAFT_1299215 [Lactarius quietus]|nr:hypothetical protein EI94DRAFT_1299215 [Lactarius quietus]
MTIVMMFASIAGRRRGSWLKGNPHRLFQGRLEYNLWIVQKYGEDSCFGSTVYVSDPLALHHIVMKEQHIYVETDGKQGHFREGLISLFANSIEDGARYSFLSCHWPACSMLELLPVIRPIASKMCTVSPFTVARRRW